MLRPRPLTATLLSALGAAASVLTPTVARAADPLRIVGMNCASTQAGTNYGRINCLVFWTGGTDPSTATFQASYSGVLRDRLEESESANRKATFAASCWTPDDIIVTATVTDSAGVRATWQVPTRCNTGRAGQ